MKDRGKVTRMVDYLGNPIVIGQMVLYAAAKSGQTYTLTTGTVIRIATIKMKVLPLGKTGEYHEEWVHPGAAVNLKNLSNGD
jgi:hypothetical protein